MIRKAIIALLTLAGLATTVAWATSYDAGPPERPRWPVKFAYSWWDAQEFLCIMSIRGWLRIGILQSTDPAGSLLAPDARDRVKQFQYDLSASPERWSSSGGREAPWSGFVQTASYKNQSRKATVIAVSHWLVCVIFLTYPTIVFIRGSLQRSLRRKRGLCIRCGYDLAGNVSGTCPECGASI